MPTITQIKSCIYVFQILFKEIYSEKGKGRCLVPWVQSASVLRLSGAELVEHLMTSNIYFSDFGGTR